MSEFVLTQPLRRKLAIRGVLAATATLATLVGVGLYVEFGPSNAYRTLPQAAGESAAHYQERVAGAIAGGVVWPGGPATGPEGYMDQAVVDATIRAASPR